MMSVNVRDIDTLNIKDCDYCCFISLINKNEAINLLQNAPLTEKSGSLSIAKIYIYVFFFFESIYKIRKTIIKFDNIEIQRQTFHHHKRPISIQNVYFNKIVVSNKVSVGKKGFKYFIGYKDTKNIRPLCTFLSKMSAYRKDFDETKYISLLIKDDELLKNTIKFGKK